MLNKITATSLLLSVATASLLAGGNAQNESSARLDGLGLNVYQTADSYNIWANPAFMAKYQSEATVNVKGQDISSVMAGGNFGTSAGAFGIYFGRGSQNLTEVMNDKVNGVGYTGTYTTPLSENQFDLMYAISLGDSADLGFRLSRKGRDISTKSTGGENELYTSEYEFEGGVLLPEIGLDLSLALGFPNYMDVSKPNVGGDFGLESDGSIFVTVQGGFDLPIDEMSKVRINAFIGSWNLGSKEIANGADEKREETRFDFWTTVTYDNKLTETTTLFLNTGLIYGSVEKSLKGAGDTGKQENSTLMIPVVASVEAVVTESVTVRAGASLENFNLYNFQKVENNAFYTESSPASTMKARLNVGFGYAPTDDVDIDAVIGNGTLFNGSNILSGLASKITGTYRF